MVPPIEVHRHLRHLRHGPGRKECRQTDCPETIQNRTSTASPRCRNRTYANTELTPANASCVICVICVIATCRFEQSRRSYGVRKRSKIAIAWLDAIVIRAVRRTTRPAAPRKTLFSVQIQSPRMGHAMHALSAFTWPGRLHLIAAGSTAEKGGRSIAEKGSEREAIACDRSERR